MSVTIFDQFKRASDVVGAVVAILLTAPLQVGVAVAVRVALGSPVLFRQHRAGKNAKIFTLIKFRSMRHPDREAGIVTDAERLTKFGRILRSTSLDELPSLWNVLIGDMSFVGPRPLLKEYLPLYSARQGTRHDVRPGITGSAQVSGRSGLSWPA